MTTFIATPVSFPSTFPIAPSPWSRSSFSSPRQCSGAVRRRNALVPLPLLPPPPINTVVTSVKILHNQPPISPPESPTSIECEGWLPSSTPPPLPVGGGGEEEDNPNNSSNTDPVVEVEPGDKPKTPSISPTQSSFCFSPLSSNMRLRSQRRRSCTPCSPPIPRAAAPQLCQPPGSDIMIVQQNQPSPIPSSLQRFRRPRSIITVTVRRVNTPPREAPTDTKSSSSPQPPPSITPRATPVTELSPKKPTISSPPPVPLKPKYNKPRLSSGLATCVPIVASSSEDEEMANIRSTSTPSVSRAVKPVVMRSLRTKKSKPSKMGSRLAMLRWAVLNQSGPEVGRRILAMGVRLAKEIWEAEQCIDDAVGEGEEIKLTSGSTMMRGSIVPVDAKDDKDVSMLDAEDEQERIAEECIRDLEDMDVDQDHIDEYYLSTTTPDVPMDVDTVTPSSLVPPPVTPSIASSLIPPVVPHSRRRLSFLRSVQVRVDLEVEIFSKTASNSNRGCGGGPGHLRRRSLVDDKLSIVTAAKKWFEKTAL